METKWVIILLVLAVGTMYWMGYCVVLALRSRKQLDNNTTQKSTPTPKTPREARAKDRLRKRESKLLEKQKRIGDEIFNTLLIAWKTYGSLPCRQVLKNEDFAGEYWIKVNSVSTDGKCLVEKLLLVTINLRRRWDYVVHIEISHLGHKTWDLSEISGINMVKGLARNLFSH